MYRGSLIPVEVEAMRDPHGPEHRYNCRGECAKCKAKTSIRGTRVQVLARGHWSYAVKSSRGQLFAVDNGRVVVPCRGCETPRFGRQVDGKFSATKFCDARCMNATGPNCECQCGGLNHGGSFDLL